MATLRSAVPHALFCAPAVLAFTLIASAAVAQQPEDAHQAVAPRLDAAVAEIVPSALQAPAAAPSDPALIAPDDDLFHTPIRGGADDNGHRYGTWASGPRYKVSFHDGMAFYPVLGGCYPHNLPVRWTTTSVRIGAAELLRDGESPRGVATDWRYEYRFERVTESYDVLKAGVEQRFTIHDRPAEIGDLVILGRMASELRTARRDYEHAALVFEHEDGTEIVSYGEAVAIDADGRRQPMETAFDGDHVRLRLDGAWLRQARFPLVVDPLLGNVLVAFDSTNRQASRPTVAYDHLANQMLTAYGRLNSGGDYDAFARITAPDFTGTTTVWTDITASWSTRNTNIAFVGGAARWILVMQRDFSGTTGSWIRYHVRDSGDMTSSTAWSSLAGSTGNTLSVPDVGGAITGNNALVVYQSDAGLSNSNASRVLAHVVNVATTSVGPVIDLQTGANFDRETPSVNQVSNGGASASWICCWSQLDNSITNDDWDLIVCRINAAGTIQGSNFLGNANATVHAFLPKVAGRGGRYMVCYGEATNPPGNEINAWANEIWAHRFDWSETSSAPVKLDNRRVRAPSAGIRFWNGGIAYDHNTLSHWALVYHSDNWNVFTARIGHDAGVCETATLWSNTSAGLGFSPTITFNGSANVFPLVFTTSEGGTQPHPVYGNRFAYPSFSNPIPYGIGCGPAVLGSNANAHSRKPHRGAQFFSITATSVPTNAAGALHIGGAPTGVPIPFLPGCFSNTSPLLTLPMSATGTTASLPLPIPSHIVGDLFLQYVYLDPGYVNPIPVRLSRGLQVLIR